MKCLWLCSVVFIVDVGVSIKSHCLCFHVVAFFVHTMGDSDMVADLMKGVTDRYVAAQAKKADERVRDQLPAFLNPPRNKPRENLVEQPRPEDAEDSDAEVDADFVQEFESWDDVHDVLPKAARSVIAHIFPQKVFLKPDPRFRKNFL